MSSAGTIRRPRGRTRGRVTRPLSAGRRIARRALDLLGSAAGLIALSPLLLVLALGVKPTSTGPVLFVQARADPRLLVARRGLGCDSLLALGLLWTVIHLGRRL